MLEGLIAAAALVAVATAIGLLSRALGGRRRRGNSDRIRPVDFALESDAFGERATLLQFSTEWCSRCPATRRLLGDTAGRHDGVRHAEVDLTHRADLAARYGVTQTPTTFVLDGAGAVRARIGGAPRPAAIEAALADATASTQAQEVRA